MEQYRLLLPNERDALMAIYKNNPGRKIIHIFFNIWKCIFLFIAIIAVWDVIDRIIVDKDYANIFSLFVLIPAFFMFWVFPNFILKRIDANYDALKNNQVYIKNTELISIRHNRERVSSSSHHHKDVYYATIANEYNVNGNSCDTYEILAHESLSNLPAGTIISVLRFGFDNTQSLRLNDAQSINQEYAVPVDFLYNKSLSLPLM